MMAHGPVARPQADRFAPVADFVLDRGLQVPGAALRNVVRPERGY